MTQVSLPFDVLLHIVWFAHDVRSLVLVNRAFYDATMPSLYTTITLLGLKEYGSELNYPPLHTLDRHPHLRSYVKVVEVCFTQQTRRGHWATSLSKLTNVKSLRVWHPEKRYYPVPADFMTKLMDAVGDSCEEISLLARVNEGDIGRMRAPLPKVQRVDLGMVTSSAFPALNDWMKESDCHSLSIREPYLADSTSPRSSRLIGIESLRTLRIGGGHGLSNRDLLDILAYSPRLVFLDLVYDSFSSDTRPSDDNYTSPPAYLKVAVIRHSGVWSKPSCQALFHWLQAILSPPLQSFSLISDDGKEIHHPTELVKVLSICNNLTILNTPSVAFRLTHLSNIFTVLPLLRVLSLFITDIKSVGFYKETLVALYLSSNRPSCPYFSVAPKVMGGHGSLKRLSQVKQTWKALWTQGPVTDRGEAELLEFEYPDVYY